MMEKHGTLEFSHENIVLETGKAIDKEDMSNNDKYECITVHARREVPVS